MHATIFRTGKSLVFALSAGLMLSACVIAVDHHDDIDDDDHKHNSSVKVRLDDGDYHRFRCPEGYSPFVKTEDNGETTFGCRQI